MAAKPADEFDGFVDDVLSGPEPSALGPARLRPTAPIPVVTAPVMIWGRRRMQRMLPAVQAVRVLGSGLLQDLSRGLRDVVGGRAGTIEEAIGKQLDSLQSQVRNTAAGQGAGAVVSYSVQVSTLGGLTMLIATGTPVILSDDA